MNKEKTKASILSFLKLDIIEEFIYSGIGCLFFIILYNFFPKNYWSETYRTTFILVLTLSFFFVFLLINQVYSGKKFFNVSYKRNTILFTIYLFALILFIFYDTYWGYNGLSGDNFYRTAYITQMAYSGYPQDFVYKDLSAFYSPLYWYGLALLARLLQIRPFKMIRIGMLITCYILPIILFESWKKIYNEKISFIITTLSLISLLSIYGPDHMIGFLTIIPFFIYFYENYPAKDFTKKNYIIAGILGSLIFCTYFFYFLMIPIYYLISLIQNNKKFRDKFKHIIYITIAISIFSSWFWLPLIRDIVLIGFESHQNNYFSLEILILPFNWFISFSLIGVFHAIGLSYIIRRYTLSRDIKILGNLLLSINLLFLIGFIGILNNLPIMHIRLLPIYHYVLIISTSIFYVRLFYFLEQNKTLKIKKFHIQFYQLEIYILIVIICIYGANSTIAKTKHQAYKAAQDQDVRYQLIDKFEQLDYEDKVFLTDQWVIAAYLPVYLFLLPNPYFTHPSALYNQRVEFLIELSECDSSKEFHKKIMESKFGPIDYFYLDFEENDTKLVFEFAVEKFPEGRDYYEIEFDRDLFEDVEYFKEIEIEGDIIYKTKY